MRRRSLRIRREPKADFRGFRMMRLNLKDSLIVRARAIELAKLLRIKVGERQVCPSLGRILLSDALQLLHGIQPVTACLQRESEIVSGIG